MIMKIFEKAKKAEAGQGSEREPVAHRGRRRRWRGSGVPQPADDAAGSGGAAVVGAEPLRRALRPAQRRVGNEVGMANQATG